MKKTPFSFVLPFPSLVPSQVDNHIVRRLSQMKGQFQDSNAYERMLSQDDCVIYEVYEIKRPEVQGELQLGISIVHPGKVGREYFMTKGHFHAVLDTAEVYYCFKGEGCMVMETPDGETMVEMLSPGKVLYVPPRWAHRSVCTGRCEDLVTFFVYPGNSGHDYGTIEKNGFRKIVIDGAEGAILDDNPRRSDGE